MATAIATSAATSEEARRTTIRKPRETPSCSWTSTFDASSAEMNWFEFIAAVITLVSIWLATRENIWYYPTGVVALVMYTWLFYEAKLYAESVLQIVCLALML